MIRFIFVSKFKISTNNYWSNNS